MTSKKLGALLRSAPPATADREPAEPPPTTPAAIAETPLAAPAPRRQAPPKSAAEPEVPLQVLIPAHIRKKLGVMAAEQEQSLRALILSAIRSLGIAVSDADIEGKRGRRNS